MCQLISRFADTEEVVTQTQVNEEGNVPGSKDTPDRPDPDSDTSTDELANFNESSQSDECDDNTKSRQSPRLDKAGDCKAPSHELS